MACGGAAIVSSSRRRKCLTALCNVEASVRSASTGAGRHRKVQLGLHILEVG